MSLCRCEAVKVDGTCYWHLKIEAGLFEGSPNGHGLSLSQRSFVGLFPTPRARGGWHQPDAMPSLAAFHDEGGEAWMSDEERRLLQVLCDPPSRGWGGDPDG